MKYNSDDLEFITEGRFIDGMIILVLTTRLLKPFKTWQAYKLKLIDDKGELIKKPETDKEKDAWTLLDKFLAKIKKFFIKHKFVGSLLSFYVLMKEDSETQDDSVEYLVESRRKETKVKELSYKIKNEIIKEGLDEEEFYKILTNIHIKETIDARKRR